MLSTHPWPLWPGLVFKGKPTEESDIAKFELTPARGQKRRLAVALISSCELTDTGSASQPAVKSFGMDKMQLLEPEMGTQAIPVFQRLRRLTMRLNPTNQDRPKTTLHVANLKPNFEIIRKEGRLWL